MSRTRSEQTNAVGHDSFLDVVTNMVGILIVLALVVGLRIKNTPVSFQPTREMFGAAQSLEKDQATEQSLRSEIAEISRQTESVAREVFLRDQERKWLATAATAAEHEIRQRRERLQGTAKEDFDRARELAGTRKQLEEHDRQRAGLEAEKGETVVVESYPTPLAKTVFDEEVQFQLRGAHIALVPVEKLVLLARDDARAKADKLVERGPLPELTETVGPENGFRFRYTVQRHDAVEQTPAGPVRRVSLRLVRWTVIPVGSQLGEPVEVALGQDSQFRRVLAGLRPGATATIWVYEDSFASFRQIRKELYRLGIPVAARPLPEGTMISGSPRGSRSEAE